MVIAQNNISKDFSIKTVVLDAGHGGKDPGAVGYDGLKEKDVALAIALKTGNYIKEFVPGVKVIYTRSTDEFIELYQRAKIANKADADLFISIHANAVPNKSHVHGTETFVLGTHKNAANLAVAKRENASILMEKDYLVSYDGFDPNKPETHIIMSIMQSAHKYESVAFAGFVEDQFVNRAKRHSRGVKEAGFMVLHKTTMPSVLVETGFVTNKNEAKYLASEKGQEEIASAIYRAFKEYKAQMEGDEATTENKLVDISQEKKPSSTPAEPKVVKESVVQSEAKVKESSRAYATEYKAPANRKPASGSNSKDFKIYNKAAGKNDSKGIYRLELYSSEKSYIGSSKILDRIGDIVVEYNSSKGIRKYMLVDEYAGKASAQAKLKEIQDLGFKNAKLILYQNGRRIVQ